MKTVRRIIRDARIGWAEGGALRRARKPDPRWIWQAPFLAAVQASLAITYTLARNWGMVALCLTFVALMVWVTVSDARRVGRHLAPDGFVPATCARRGEPVLVKASDPENFGMVLCDPCAFEVALADCYVKHGAGRPMSVRTRLAAEAWLRQRREEHE